VRVIVITRSRRIDWPRIVANLQSTGLSLREIADHVDVAKASVCDYCNPDAETEPAFWVGAALLVLWSERTRLPWTDAPVRTVAPSVSQVLRAHR
jgi:lambda repressor-like predicted transcriptional regulator